MFCAVLKLSPSSFRGRAGRECKKPGFGVWGLQLTGPKPKEITVETFRIDYLIRTLKVEKLSLQPIRQRLEVSDFGCTRSGSVEA